MSLVPILFLILVVLVICVGLFFIFKHVILGSTMTSSTGYVSSPSYEKLVGMKGKTLSVLRPGGVVEVGGKRLDARAQSEYIDRDVEITVVGVDGAQLIVDDIVAIEEDSTGGETGTT